MWDEETVEIDAVRRIKEYFEKNPMVRSLSARQRHTLKFQLKQHISKWSGSTLNGKLLVSPSELPDNKIPMANLVERTRNRPVMA